MTCKSKKVQRKFWKTLPMTSNLFFGDTQFPTFFGSSFSCHFKQSRGGGFLPVGAEPKSNEGRPSRRNYEPSVKPKCGFDAGNLHLSQRTEAFKDAVALIFKNQEQARAAASLSQLAPHSSPCEQQF
eukprot:3611084-Amphidinium_carterae.1